MSDINDIESTSELDTNLQNLANDDTVSCKSSAVPLSGIIRQREKKPNQKKLNTKAKVFTRSSDKNDASRSVSVCSGMASPLTSSNIKGKAFNMFFPAQTETSEQEFTAEYGQSIEENKDQNMLGFDFHAQRQARYSCKSVKNTNCLNSPM